MTFTLQAPYLDWICSLLGCTHVVAKLRIYLIPCGHIDVLVLF
jgi:hypothetical protein